MKVSVFTFSGVLHEGSTTLIYAGVRDADGAPVVGKMLGAEQGDLRHEFLALQKAAGPGVVDVLGLFDSSERPVLVQRRFGTSSLAEAQRRARFSVEQVLYIGSQIARVLARLHGARIVHRDIKPANILYDATSEQVALGDFGLAAELPVNAHALPLHDLVGTPSYASPEHTGRTRTGCDARSDLYSLGVTLYELLTGALPFAGHDLLDVMAAHLSRNPDPPHHRVPTIPPVVSALVMKLLAKSPDERYQSARGLAADLDRCLAELRTEGRIASFELGRSDQLRPRFPPRLFGRSTELAALEQALARASTGSPALVLLSGRDGAGRSALVRALVREAGVECPFALGGWSPTDALPLSGLADALGAMANQLLMLDEDRLVGLRQRLAARIGHIGQVVIDIVPSLGDVLGAQPALPQLATGAARARLHHAFGCLIGALGDTAPLVLALQGFEHVDPASRSVVEAILDHPATCRALVVLIAREPTAFGRLRDRPGAVSIELGPLPLEMMVEWTEATLGCDSAAAGELGAVLHARSGGNPRMYMRTLEHLVETGLIERRDAAYAWSIEAVRAAPPPPTLGALAAQRIAGCSNAARSALAAIASSDDPIDVPALAAVLEVDAEAASQHASALARDGLVVGAAGTYRTAHPMISETAIAVVGADEVARMTRRLALHLLATTGPEPTGASALRVAMVLGRSAADDTLSGLALTSSARVHAAELLARAGEHALLSTAYEVAAAVFARGAALAEIGNESAWQMHRALAFRIEVGRARALMMQRRNAEADTLFQALAQRDLTPVEVGISYGSWCDNHVMMMSRPRAVEIALEGLARLGFPLPAQPRPLLPLAAMRLNDRKLRRLTLQDHVTRPNATDERAVSALQLLSNMTASVAYSQRMDLYVLVCETAISLVMKYGHIPLAACMFGMHAVFSHAMHGDYETARRVYEVCDAIDAARPAPEAAGRTCVVLQYLVRPWFGPWRAATDRLLQAINLSAEAGDVVFAALCASSSIALLSMLGTPLDQLVAKVEGWGGLLRGDGGVAANAANIVNLAGKLSRGEPIGQADLDRVTAVPLAAGPMRTNAMVNLGLALAVVGHEGQVRAWIDEIRTTFPRMALGVPHLVTLWLLDGLFAAKDARAGASVRRADAEGILERFRALRRASGSDSNDAAIALLEAQLARADGDLDRATALFGRAVREARVRELAPMIAYANEQWAAMLEEAGFRQDALVYYREAVAAYRRWVHLTKVVELESAYPELRLRDAIRADDSRPAAGRTVGIARAASSGASTGERADPAMQPTLNDQLDLLTVLKVSQDISLQRKPPGVVRAVLTGIAQNAGAERVIFVLRDARGVEIVYGEVHDGVYRDLDVPLDNYAEVPRSIVRAVRRTSRPLVIADAINDPAHMADPFVIAKRCRSIACVPIRRNAEVVGLVMLGNRMVAGAFTPQLVSLTQALAGQAAISFDNASLYKHLEDRVTERTAALNTRNDEMRMVLDHVAQGLMIVGTDGRLLAERSAILDVWFPGGVPDAIGGFFAGEPGAAAWFELVWKQLVEGTLPLDLAIYQLPKQIPHGERVLAFDWQPIVNEVGELERVLVVLSDVTEALRRAESEREQKQLMTIFDALIEDRTGVVELMKEASALVGEITAGGNSPEVEKRLVHTLKGNAALFGLSALAARCHDIEDAMAIDARQMTDGERQGLGSAWHALYEKLSHFIDVGQGVLQVGKADFETALAVLRRDGHPLARELEVWGLEPLRVRFQRIGEQARGLAERLGKQPLRVVIEDSGLYVGSDTWAPFWSAFVHVVRNAIDHGLECADDRARLGKGMATLTLRSYLRGGALVLELSDDGRGIAWDTVRDKARAAGLATDTHADLVAALFHDGLSTLTEVSELSGRGVGLSALAAVCRAMGCQIAVDSAPGVGTTMRFEHFTAIARTRPERAELETSGSRHRAVAAKDIEPSEQRLRAEHGADA